MQTITAQNTPAPALADGAYRYRALTLSGPGQTVEATVSAGRVTAWALVSDWGERSDTPAATVAQFEGEYRAALAHEVSEAQRLAGLIHPVEFTPAPQPVNRPSAAPIGKASARALHVELSRLGYREHYAAASDALGRPVPSLAALTAAEVRTVYAYAYGSLGMTA